MPKRPSDAHAVQQNLERIARALKRPISDFLDRSNASVRETETLALVSAFELITDTKARARCIAFVSAEAERDSRNRPGTPGGLAT